MLRDHLMQLLVAIQLIFLEVFLNELHGVGTGLLVIFELFETRVEDGHYPLLYGFPRAFFFTISKSFDDIGGGLLGLLGEAIDLAHPGQQVASEIFTHLYFD
jgi:hypothetical protein